MIRRRFIARTALSAALVTLSAALTLPANAFADSETFGLLTDTHVRSQGDNATTTTNADTNTAIKWVKQLPNLKAIVIAGDVTDQGTPQDVSYFKKLWDKQKIKVPRILAMGNHDSNNGGIWGTSPNKCTKAFQTMTGGNFTTYKKFKNANIITIGGKYTTDHNKIFTDAMVRELNSRLLETVREGKWALVVCHYPYTNSFPNRNKVISVIRSYPNVIYASGHRHHYASSQWCQRVSPSVADTTFGREGADKDKKYSFISIGLDSVSRNQNRNGVWKSLGQSVASSLTVNSDHSAVLHRQNTRTGATREWTLKPATGTITVKSQAKTYKGTPAPAFTYCIRFSDNNPHGGIQSGGTFMLSAGASRSFDMPAGVLASIYCVSAPSGYAHSPATSKEATNKKSTLVMKHACSLHEIHYKGLPGDAVQPSRNTFLESDTFNLEAPTMPAGTRFICWYSAEKGGHPVSRIDLGTANDITVYARYEKTSRDAKVSSGHYTIVYMANGGSGEMISTHAVRDEDITLAPSTYNRKSYKFTGWNTKADGTGKYYAPNSKVKNLAEVNETISLYAQWSYNDVPPAPIGDSTYRIIFNANGGDGSMAVQDIVPNSSFELPANTFTNGDKKFIGWNLSADGTGVALPDRRVITSAASGEVTLYAQWEDPNLCTSASGWDCPSAISKMTDTRSPVGTPNQTEAGSHSMTGRPSIQTTRRHLRSTPSGDPSECYFPKTGGVCCSVLAAATPN